MEDQIETPFSLRGTSYRLQTAICQVTTFTISLFDDDQMDRWVGEFSAPFIEDLTRKAGSARSASVFWKMLQYAIAGTSCDITFDILSGQDVARMRSDSSSRMNPNSENMYVIVCYVTSFDQVRYPLLLHKKPYSPDEWRAIVRSLRSDNRRLQSQAAASNQSDVVRSLEAQVCELNARVKEAHAEKDRVISELKLKIAHFGANQLRPKKEIARAPPARRKAARPPAGAQIRSSRASASGSARSSAANSRASSAKGSSRSSSRNSSGSFRRFDPTEWVRNRGSRGASPAAAPRMPSKAVQRPETNLNRIRALVNQRYKY